MTALFSVFPVRIVPVVDIVVDILVQINVIIRKKLVLTDNRFLGRLRREDTSDAIMRSVNYASHVTMSIKGVSESVSVLNRS